MFNFTLDQFKYYILILGVELFIYIIQLRYVILPVDGHWKEIAVGRRPLYRVSLSLLETMCLFNGGLFICAIKVKFTRCAHLMNRV